MLLRCHNMSPFCRSEESSKIMSSSSSSPCAACKFLRRKCQPECVFAPYFPPDQPSKFTDVHKIFGASNVAKLVNELRPHQREDAVNSLAYEADMRLRDPVYGCVGVISLLQRQLRQLQVDLSLAKFELSKHQNLDCAGHGHHRQSQTSFGMGLVVGRKDQRNYYQQQMTTSLDTGNSLETAEVFAVNVSARIEQLVQLRQPKAGAREESRSEN